MTAPRRIQRRRTKGWRMPKGAIYVGRPSRWGNPITIAQIDKAYGPHPGHLNLRAVAEEAFRSWADWRIGRQSEGWLEPLRGRDLVCWCPLDQPCHADVLLELANR